MVSVVRQACIKIVGERQAVCAGERIGAHLRAVFIGFRGVILNTPLGTCLLISAMERYPFAGGDGRDSRESLRSPVDPKSCPRAPVLILSALVAFALLRSTSAPVVSSWSAQRQARPTPRPYCRSRLRLWLRSVRAAEECGDEGGLHASRERTMMKSVLLPRREVQI